MAADTDDADERSYWTVSDLHSDETASQHGQVFPKVGGKLRLLREHRPDASVHTEPLDPVQYTLPDGRTYQQARFHATVKDEGGNVLGQGTGTATWGREENHDGEMEDIENVGNENVVMLAETRAVARALRFAGFAIDAADYSEVRGKDPVGGPDARAATPQDHRQPKTNGRGETRIVVPDGYEHKETLKDAGFRFSPGEKQWFIETDTPGKFESILEEEGVDYRVES